MNKVILMGRLTKEPEVYTDRQSSGTVHFSGRQTF